MRLTYENERGKITMYGGGGRGFNIMRITGLSLPEINSASVHYPYMAGQVLTRANVMERYITISGDVRDCTRKHISRAVNVFSVPGVLYITAFGKTKKINARCVSFEPNQNKGVYIPFTVQLCADYPYFEDVYETVTKINSRTKRLSSPFVLGCAFSERVLRNNVINRGDVKTEPVFEIFSANGAVCPYGILIKNLSGGKSILLKTDVGKNELITIDIKNRKITSNQRGNILSCLSEITSLADFYLDTGVSVVEISAEEISGEMQAVCRHTNGYVSADV